MRMTIALLMGMICRLSYGEDSLCSGKEQIVFSCHMDKKMVSLCRPVDSPHELIYRFGSKGKPELTYPGPKGKKGFYRSDSPVFGGGITTLAFTRGDYEYRIYSKVGREDSAGTSEERVPVFEDGLVVSKSGKQLSLMICDDGGEGFSEDIGWVPLQKP